MRAAIQSAREWANPNPIVTTANESQENVPIGTVVEFLTNEIAKQKSAPEDFLDQWNDNHQPQESGRRSLSSRRLAGRKRLRD